MITVTININNKPIVTRSAVNISKEESMVKPNQYRLDTGKIIEHIPNDGVVTLVKKMLDTVDKRFEDGR